MEKEQVQEVIKIVNEANGGNWTPAAIVGSLLGVIIVLLLYIYVRDRKDSERKHETHGTNIAKLTEANEKLTIIVERHDIKIDHNTEKISAL